MSTKTSHDKPAKLRDSWGSRLGIIMAVAGSAVGLGNFLRFPAKAAAYGGGAFMIPYFVALFLVGIPLMWVEWTLGRYGGGFGHGTAPGIFHSIWVKNRFIKYFGIIGIFGPMVIFMFYAYIESWTLAYSYFALTGKYTSLVDQGSLKSFLSGFQGLEKNQFFSSISCAYIFFLLTFAANIAVVYHGIKGGIEKLCNWTMPVLFIFSIILFFRVITLGTPNPAHPDWNIVNGFGYLWNPDFSALTSAKVWIEAAGQILFTLSVGIGVILTYASYLKKGDDVVLSGTTAAATNEFSEVIIGGTIVIPAAFVFFGPQETTTIAQSGPFNLAFVSMPVVLNQLPFSQLLGFVWFFLLFLAGIAASVSLVQPAIAFLEDEFNITRTRAVQIFAVVSFILCHPAIFFLKNGVMDELDFWGGTFLLVVFALIEVILFSWIFGIDRAWDEIHHGADIRVPKIYKFILKYITPLFLMAILGMWFFQEWIPIILMQNVSPENKAYVLGTRIGLVALFLVLVGLVNLAWKRKRRHKGDASVNFKMTL